MAFLLRMRAQATTPSLLHEARVHDRFLFLARQFQQIGPLFFLSHDYIDSPLATSSALFTHAWLPEVASLL